MTVDLAVPDPVHAATLRRSLIRAERRARRRSGSGFAYPVAALAFFYLPSAVIGTVFELTGAPPDHPPLFHGPSGITATIAVLILLSAGWSYLGPIPAPPAWATWVLSTPLDRGVLLFHRVRARLLVAALPGIAFGAAAASASGMRDMTAAALVAIGAFGGVTAGAAAIVRQRRVRPRSWPVWLAFALATAATAALQIWPVGAVTVWSCWSVTAAAAVSMTVVVAIAARSVRRIPQDRLIAAGRLMPAVFMAMTELSLESLAHGGRSTRRSSARSRPIHGTGQEALRSACWRSVRRDTMAQVRLVVTAAVLYPLALVVHGAGGRPVLAAAAVVAAVIGLSGVAGTARRFQGAPHLPAHLGLDPRSSRRAALSIPAAMAVLWAIATAPAMAIGGAVTIAVLAAALGYAVVLYRLTRKELTPTGIMGQQYPTDLGQRFARGPLQLVLACLLAAVISMAV